MKLRVVFFSKTHFSNLIAPCRTIYITRVFVFDTASMAVFRQPFTCWKGNLWRRNEIIIFKGSRYLVAVGKPRQAARKSFTFATRTNQNYASPPDVVASKV